MKPTVFKAVNLNDWNNNLEKNKLEIATSIINAILGNIDSKRKNIHILSVKCDNEKATYDLTLPKGFFLETLEENLPIFVGLEQYETADKIVKTINKLKTNEQNK